MHRDGYTVPANVLPKEFSPWLQHGEGSSDALMPLKPQEKSIIKGLPEGFLEDSCLFSRRLWVQGGV